MSNILTRVPWTRQPQGPLSVNWSNPITRGLVVLAYPVGDRFYDAVTKQLSNGAFPTSTCAKAAEDKFVGARRITGASAGVYFPNRTGADDITGAWSVLWEGSPESNSVSGTGNGIVAGSTESSNGRGFRAGHDDANWVFNSICGGNTYASQNGTSNSIVSSFENFAFRFGVAWDTATFNLYARGTLNKSVAYSAAAPIADANRRTYIGSWILGVSAPASLSVVAIFAGSVPLSAYQAFYANPWQLFAPIPRRIWVPSTGSATTHTSTGALAALAASIAGTATHKTLHTSTGALASQAAVVAGTATHKTLHASTGALAAQAAAVAGTADHTTPSGTTHTSTGALAAQAAAIAGTAIHRILHASTGDLIAQSAAVIAGTAIRHALHTSTGVLASQSATIAGSASGPGPDDVSGDTIVALRSISHNTHRRM